MADILLANSEKLFSFSKREDGKNICVPATDYERVLAKEESAAATARLAINKAMIGSG
ncbi:hypothetical protein [Halomonas sp. LBP4]|uniref:hypothetical protein n=1 Tax=Halomonas sp. LBP4 TaxID=2044917 RepID=UPI0015E8B0F5|nr:hypothetical protein [Halomonas sp. LBP4]